jgi:hypothetical protein
MVTAAAKKSVMISAKKGRTALAAREAPPLLSELTP